MSHTTEQIKALAEQLLCHPVSRSIDEIETAGELLIELLNQCKELMSAQWTIAQGSAALAIEKCKNASSQRRTIEMYVSANQCAEDILYAISRAKAAK